MPLDSELPLFHKSNQRLLNQLRGLEKIATQWNDNYETMQDVTERAIRIRRPVPGRNNDLFMLCRKRNNNISNKQRERQLEQSLWRQWRASSVKISKGDFLAGVLQGFVSYQVPLRQGEIDKQRAADLIGVTPYDGLPVVIELKKENGDIPLWTLAEAYGYALAIRKNWNEGELREQWKSRVLVPSGIKCDAPIVLKSVPVLLAAPEAYWLQCIGIGGKRQRGEIDRPKWQALNKLIQRITEAGFPVTCVAFDVEYGSKNVPLIHSPRVRVLPNTE